MYKIKLIDNIVLLGLPLEKKISLVPFYVCLDSIAAFRDSSFWCPQSFTLSFPT